MASYTDLANAYIPEKTGGGKPDNPDYTIWMTEALQLIINASPTDMLWLFETSEDDAGEDGVDIGSNKILYVLRESDSNLIDTPGGVAVNDAKMLVECREVPASLRGRLQPGSGWMEEVSETDPVFYKLGKKIYILPSSDSTNTKVYWIKNPPTSMTGASDYLAGTSGIPSEVEPIVMSWCIYKGVGKTLAKLMTEHRDEKANLHESLTEINAALSSGNSALGEISGSVGKMTDLIDKTEEKIDDFYTAKAHILNTTELWDNTNKRFQVIRDALNSADSLITNDASTNVSDTNIALNKISGLVEKSEDALGTSSDGDIKDALTNANGILAECQLINDKIDEEVDASKLLTSDVDSAMQKAITELDEAIADTDSDGNFATAITSMKNALAEYSTYQTGGNIDGVQGAIQNAQGLIDGNLPTSEFDAFNLIEEEELDVLQAVVQTAGAELQRAQSYIAEWQAASGVLGQEVQGFASEVQTRSAFVQAKSVVWQGAVAVAQGYLAEIQGKLNVAQGYGSQVQSKLAVVQGYSGEVQTRIAHSGAFGAVANITGNEGQMRLQQLTATTQTAAHELNRATIAVQEITTLVSVHGLDLQGVQQYIAAMQQWFQQSQGYLGEAQGYYGEVTARLALITSRLSEKQINNALLSAAYQEMMACQERHYNEFNQALQMLQAGTYQVQAKDDIKKLPTYTGIAE